MGHTRKIDIIDNKKTLLILWKNLFISIKVNNTIMQKRKEKYESWMEIQDMREKKIFFLHYFYYCYYQGRESLDKSDIFF